MTVEQTIRTAEPWASPAALRNIRPLAEAIAPFLPQSGTVLEVASARGFHAACLAAAFADLTWQPSALEPDDVQAATALVQELGLSNLAGPIALDATQVPWPLDGAAAVLNMNMIHISPWAVAEGLMKGCGSILPEGGRLFLYGPFKENGRHTAPSNEAFDESLRSRDPAWGVRDLGDVSQEAGRNMLALVERVQMPANNQLLVFEKQC